MIRGAQILVVEDEPLSRDMLMRALTARGFRTHAVGDGPACLEWLEQNTPDLVLLDVSMPGMSGLDVLHSIRQCNPGDRLPVILVSALINSDDVVAGLDAGANDYVVKPVNVPVLLARIGACLRMKRNVQRLVEAERHRVMLESLATTCDRLAEPMRTVIDRLEELRRELPDDRDAVREQLGDVLDWANRVGELIRKLQDVADYRRVPYTQGIGSFIAATLEEAMEADDG
ncbi:MAG: response regulator transcription factor [Planctomycetota bacterium]|jgi:DNA-binding response OmpR family regulator